LIATILLIVVSVILITVILTWGKSFVLENTTKTNISYTKNLEHTIFAKNYILSNNPSTQNSVILQNTNINAITIVSYKLIDPYGEYRYLNKDVNLEIPITLAPGSLSPISIICFPNNNFTILLKTDEDQYISVNANTGYLPYSGYCLGETGLIFREHFYSEESVIANGGFSTNVLFNNGIGEFNGIDSYITYPNLKTKNFTKFTLRAKLKPKNLNNLIGSVDVGTGNTVDGFGFNVDGVNQGSSITHPHFAIDNNENSSGKMKLFSDDELSIDKFYDFVGVWQAGGVFLFSIDGEIKKQSTVSLNSYIFVNSDLRIGRTDRDGDVFGFFDFDFVEVYDIALTFWQINLMYDLDNK